MARRSLGYLPDIPDRQDLDLAALSLPSSDLPAANSMLVHVPEILDQATTSSCVVQTFAQGIVVAERAAGVIVELPSRLFMYFNARRQANLLVLDQGTYLRSAAAALQKLGAPPESLWQFATNPLTVNRRPPFEAYLGAYARRGGEYRRIFESGRGRTLAVKAAICAGMPVAFGTQVGDSFMRSEGPDIIGPPHGEKLAGGHAMLIVGYAPSPDGVLFEVVNSWGRHWRNAGTWRMTEEYLQWAPTADLWCIRGWEAMRDAA